MKSKLMLILFTLLILGLFGCGGGGNGSGEKQSGGEEGNETSSYSILAEGVVLIGEDAVYSESVQVNDEGNFQIDIDTSVVSDLTVGSVISIPAGTEDRFPLGFSGRVISKESSEGDMARITVEDVAISDIFSESKLEVESFPLTVDNFIGVIAPSSIEALEPVAATASSRTYHNDKYVFRNGAIVLHSAPASLTKSAAVNLDDILYWDENFSTNSICADEEAGINYANCISLNLGVRLAKNMMPEDTDAVIEIKGMLRELKLVLRHNLEPQWNLLNIVDYMDYHVTGIIKYDISLRGNHKRSLGYTSDAWEEVSNVSSDMLGIKLTGLDSQDKRGKYPVAGLVWSVPAGISTGLGLKDSISMARIGGIIIWVYLNAKGEIELDGGVNFVRLNDTSMKIGLEKKNEPNSDFDFVSVFNRLKQDKPMAEMLSIDGRLEAEVKAGLSIEADVFLSGIRAVNFGADIGLEGQAGVEGKVGLVTNNMLDSPWSWQGDACIYANIGAGAVIHGAVGLGIELATKWVRFGSGFDYAFQYPTDEAKRTPGRHGLFYTMKGHQSCLGNNPPVITGAPPTTGRVGQLYSFQPIIGDPDNDPLTLTIQNKPSWATFNPLNGSLTGNPDIAGEWKNIRITVSDGKGGTDTLSFDITISLEPVNNPPVISGTPPTTGRVGQLYSFTPNISDPDNDPLTLSIVNRPSWATFNPTNGSLTGNPDIAGEWKNIRIVASDGKGGTGTLSFDIAITIEPVNNSPVISGTPPATGSVGQLYSFSPTISDSDNDPLTLIIVNIPDWAVFNANTGSLTGTPNAAGEFKNIRIIANDGKGGITTVSFDITITEQPVTPIPTGRLKKTGQTVSYADYDDGYYQAGVEPSYSRANDIVTDHVTGLMWQDNAEAAAVTRNWQGAIDYCEALSLGGYNDWRLPSIEELETIVDYGRYSPAIDPVFQNISSSSWYWSYTANVYNTLDALGVHFYYGSGVNAGFKTSSNYVRCVRSGQ